MGKGIGDDLRQIGVVTRYELLKHIRSRRMLIFIAIGVLLLALITALNIILEGHLPKDPKEFMQNYVGLITLFIIIGVSLFCAPAIASEFEERTALLMFPRPMKKTTFFIGKMTACYIVCGLIILGYYLVAMILSVLNTGTVYPNTFGSIGLAMLFMLGTGGFALLISSIFRKGSTAVIVTIAVLLLIFNIVDSMLMIFDIEPVFSITYAGLDVSNIIDGKVTTSFPPGFGISGTFFYPTHTLAVSIMAIYASVATAIAAFLFARREF